MAAGPFTDVVRYLRALVGLRGGADLADADLLRRFAAHRDEAAFAELVRRHGPLVLGVCRRLLRDAHDAEDAFQATFLVLVRRAGAIGRGELLANWLYGVAYRVAVRARARAARRRAEERQAEAMTAPAPDDAAALRELGPLLHAEVQRLPAKYRLPVVLCYLEGRTNEEAAQLLGWPKGTVSGRLARARDLLRARLTRRGVLLSAGAVAGLCAAEAVLAVPPELAAATVRTALLFAAGGAAAGTVPAPILALAEGVLRAMFLDKLKTVAVLLLAAHLVILGAGVLVYQALAAPPPELKADDAPKPAAEAPKPEAVARERATLQGHSDMVWAVAWAPDGKTLATVSGLYKKPGEVILWDAATGKERARVAKERGIRSLAFAPDGKVLATADYYDNTVRLRDPATGAERAVLEQGSANNAVAFSPDSKTLAVALLAGKTIKLWDVASRRELRTLVGNTDWVPHVAFAPDGRTLASGGSDKSVRLWDAGTGKETATLPGHDGIVEFVAFSPDGRTLATACWDQTVKLWEVASGKERATLKGHKFPVLSVAWAPDGKTLASTSGEATSPIVDTNEKPGEVKLWDALTLQEVAGFQGHKFRVWCAAFSPDGKSLATSSDDRTAKLWDLAPRPPRPGEELSAKELEALWADLAGTDAVRAYQAIGKLALAPAAAVPFLRGRLKADAPRDEAEGKRLAKLVADLDNNEFAVREKATEELEKIGPAAESALTRALEGEPSVEVRRRAERLLEKVRGPVASPEVLRALRAVEALEHAGTPEARQAVEALAKGAPDGRLTREAKAAAGRLGKRAAP